jgi:hypothetical protein
VFVHGTYGATLPLPIYIVLSTLTFLERVVSFLNVLKPVCNRRTFGLTVVLRIEGTVFGKTESNCSFPQVTMGNWFSSILLTVELMINYGRSRQVRVLSDNRKVRLVKSKIMEYGF